MPFRVVSQLGVTGLDCENHRVVEADSRQAIDAETRLASAARRRDGDYLPVVKVEPVYPTRALARRLEGWVIVRFTVTETGSVTDIEVIESSDPLFEGSAVEAAQRFKYRPRIIDGQPIEVRGVLHRISVVLGQVSAAVVQAESRTSVVRRYAGAQREA